METLFHDLRFGFRRLIKTPGFAVIAVLSLALGIGANTAVFSLVNMILFRPLPVADPQEVVSVSPSGKTDNSPRSPIRTISISATATRSCRDCSSTVSWG